jgi:cytochrome c peroxidase
MKPAPARKILLLAAAGLVLFAGEIAGQPTGQETQQVARIDSAEKFGEALFSDPLLSFNHQMNCATCHKPERMFTDGIKRPVGGSKHIEGGRNTPTLLGVGDAASFFWDGGITSLEAQAIRVIRSPIEMDRNLKDLLEDLNENVWYREASQRLFGSPVTEEVIATSLARYERTLRRRDTLYDRFLGGDSQALTGNALVGYRLFSGKAGCAQCHNGRDLTDHGFHNLGVPSDGPLHDDWGRYGITKAPEDMHKFKTPTLKGVAYTAPYMHNGVFETLEEVLAFKNRGCGKDPNLSPHCRPLNLTAIEVFAIIEFLRTL